METRHVLNGLCCYLMGRDYYKNYTSSDYCLGITRENKNAILLFDLECKYRRYKPKNKIFKYKKESKEAIQNRINFLSGNTEDQSMNSISDQKTINEICDHLLGEDWYIVDPLTTEQVNRIIVQEIEMKYKRVK